MYYQLCRLCMHARNTVVGWRRGTIACDVVLGWHNFPSARQPSQPGPTAYKTLHQLAYSHASCRQSTQSCCGWTWELKS
jgi:hypothetical protein